MDLCFLNEAQIFLQYLILYLQSFRRFALRLLTLLRISSVMSLRNLRQRLHHNAANTSSLCQPGSFVRQGTAENHNHDREAIMREQMRTRFKKKKKSVSDNNCKKTGRAANRLWIGQTRSRARGKLPLIARGQDCLPWTGCLNGPLALSACCKDKGCRNGNVDVFMTKQLPPLSAT